MLAEPFLALDDFNQMIKLNPEDAVAYNFRGLAYKHLKDYKKALADYKQAIAINPDYAAAYGNRGIIYYELGVSQKAIADLRTAADLFQEQKDNYGYQQIQAIIKSLPLASESENPAPR